MTERFVTEEGMRKKIRETRFVVIEGTTLTICILTLENGFSVRGESACVDPAHFNQEKGEKNAYEDAFRKLWPLEGYLLAEEMYIAKHNPIPAQVKLDKIARVCHEVNREYCRALGDNSQLAWEDAPEWQRASARMGVDLHLMGDHGPEASHLSWMQQKLDEGWVWGAVKDPEAKQHPCIVPFGLLPKEQQAKDFIFRAVVHALKDF